MPDKIYGDAGCLYIPDVGVMVAIYDKGKRKIAQDIVDAPNSAIYCKKFKGGCDYIADHSIQGFDAIKKCTIGSTAYIVTPNSSTVYECVQISKGTNKSSDLVTIGGQRVSKIKWADLCCYCCNYDSNNSITMVFFKRGNKLNYSLFKENANDNTTNSNANNKN